MQSHEQKVIKTLVTIRQKENARFMYKCVTRSPVVSQRSVAVLCNDLKSPMWCHDVRCLSFGWKPSWMKCDRWRHVSHMPIMHDFTFTCLPLAGGHIRAHLSSVLSILVSDALGVLLMGSYGWLTVKLCVRLFCLLIFVLQIWLCNFYFNQHFDVFIRTAGDAWTSAPTPSCCLVVTPPPRRRYLRTA